MAGKRQEVREALTRRILEATSARIAKHGLSDLRARDVANDAECGLGTIYKCFADLDDLVMAVNAATLGKLDHALGKAARKAQDPDAQLQAIADAYLSFALRQGQLWSALFEHRLAEGGVWPDWYLERHEHLLRYIREPLEQLQPQLNDAALDLRMRSFFASVHGVVMLSLEGRFIGVRQSVLREEVRAFVDLLIRGTRSLARK